MESLWSLPDGAQIGREVMSEASGRVFAEAVLLELSRRTSSDTRDIGGGRKGDNSQSVKGLARDGEMGGRGRSRLVR